MFHRAGCGDGQSWHLHPALRLLAPQPCCCLCVSFWSLSLWSEGEVLMLSRVCCSLFVCMLADLVWSWHWQSGWLPPPHTYWLPDWLTDPLTVWLTIRLTDCLPDYLAGWLFIYLTYWLSDWLTSWPTDWLTDWLCDWLPVWVTDWLSDWLTNGLID